MKEFIDQTSEIEGTKINREVLMAVQGFQDNTITFNEDGSIIETNAQGHTLTTAFNENGSITETFVGDKTITKTTRFNDDGSITEELN